MKEYESRHDDDDELFMEVILFYGGLDKIPRPEKGFCSRPWLFIPEELLEDERK